MFKMHFYMGIYRRKFISQLAMFTHPDHPKYVCRLKKSLYGLKQSPRAWYTKLSEFLQDYGFLHPSQILLYSSIEPLLFAYTFWYM